MQRRKFLTSTVPTTLGISAEVWPRSIEAADGPKKGFVVKAGQSRFGEKTKLFGVNPSDLKVSTKDTEGALTVIEYTGREKGGPPLHICPTQDQTFYVLEGEYLFEVGGERARLTAGDLIFAPRNLPHTFAQLTDSGRMLFILQPSGKMEDYFRKLGTLNGKPAPKEGASLLADFDIQVAGPPLPIE